MDRPNPYLKCESLRPAAITDLTSPESCVLPQPEPAKRSADFLQRVEERSSAELNVGFSPDANSLIRKASSSSSWLGDVKCISVASAQAVPDKGSGSQVVACNEGMSNALATVAPVDTVIVNSVTIAPVTI